MPASIKLDELVNLVPQLHRQLSCQVTDTGELSQMSMSQYRAMAFIRRNPESTLGDVARELDITLGSASDLIERLVSLDFIARDTNPHDRRQVRLSLTASALDKILRMRAERQRQLLLVKETMTDEQWDAFAGGLTRWVAVLNECTPRRHDLQPTQRGTSSE